VENGDWHCQASGVPVIHFRDELDVSHQQYPIYALRKSWKNGDGREWS